MQALLDRVISVLVVPGTAEFEFESFDLIVAQWLATVIMSPSVRSINGLLACLVICTFATENGCTGPRCHNLICSDSRQISCLYSLVSVPCCAPRPPAAAATWDGSEAIWVGF